MGGLFFRRDGSPNGLRSATRWSRTKADRRHGWRCTPLWSQDGEDVYYACDGQLWAVTIETESGFRVGTPRSLFGGPYDLDVGREIPDASALRGSPDLPRGLQLVRRAQSPRAHRKLKRFSCPFGGSDLGGRVWPMDAQQAHRFARAVGLGFHFKRTKPDCWWTISGAGSSGRERSATPKRCCGFSASSDHKKRRSSKGRASR